jgi:hypothetical protein
MKELSKLCSRLLHNQPAPIAGLSYGKVSSLARQLPWIQNLLLISSWQNRQENFDGKRAEYE